MTQYFTRLGKVGLGNLDRIYAFTNSLSTLIEKLDQYPANTQIHTNMELDPGDDLICMRYGKNNGFYTIKGEPLKAMFDDWDSIQKWVESKVGKTAEQFPLMSFTKNHLFKHIDLKRSATVNMGLWNSSDSNTVFWEGCDIVASARYEVGEAILAHVTHSHSIILNDSPSYFKHRAVLMWTVINSYDDTIKLL